MKRLLLLTFAALCALALFVFFAKLRMRPRRFLNALAAVDADADILFYRANIGELFSAF